MHVFAERRAHPLVMTFEMAVKITPAETRSAAKVASMLHSTDWNGSQALHDPVHKGRKHMRALSIALAVTMFVATPVLASEQSDVMKPIHQFVDGFNKGDAKT